MASEDERRANAEEILGQLPSKEQQVLRLLFGLYDERRWSLEEVAELFGVDAERVRDVKAKALHKLRLPNHLRSHP